MSGHSNKTKDEHPHESSICNIMLSATSKGGGGTKDNNGGKIIDEYTVTQVEYVISHTIIL